MTGLDRIRGWFTTESRAGTTQNDYTALRVSEAVERVAGAYGLRGTEAYQGALNAIENAASVAELQGEWAEILQPHLGAVARGLVDCGESTFELQVDGEGRLVLLPAKIASVSGSADPATWRYNVIRRGPTQNVSIERPAAAVVAFRQHSDPNVPWRGRASLAANSGALLADLQHQLGQEARLAVARVINTGIAVSQQRNEITAAVAEGGIVAVGSARHGAAGAPSPTLQPGAIGAGFEQPSVELHEHLTRLVSGAMGLPANLLLGDGDGAAAREAFRRMAAETLGGIFAAIRAEWESKVGPLQISLDKLRASDETARARAFGSRSNAVQKLVASGVEVGKALELAGLA